MVIFLLNIGEGYRHDTSTCNAIYDNLFRFRASFNKKTIGVAVKAIDKRCGERLCPALL